MISILRSTTVEMPDGDRAPAQEEVANLYRDPNDWYIGYYRGDEHHYVCVLTFVLRWQRR